MALKQFTFDPDLTDSFISFVYEIYRNDPKWIAPLRRELLNQFLPQFPFYGKPANHHQHFLATVDRKVVGRVSAMVNNDLKDEHATAVGTIGFFECIDDYAVAKDLLDAATNWLREQHNIRCIWGPMNFDIWHGYRLMTRGFHEEPFFGEPYNKPYYSEFFERYGFTPRQHWDSIEINGCVALEALIKEKQAQYENFIQQGYRFEYFDLHRFDDEIFKLHEVMAKSFEKFPGFTHISPEEFLQLFAASRAAFHPRLFTFVYDQEHTLVGFAGAFLDLASAVRSMQGRNGFISKLQFMYRRNQTRRILFHLGGMIAEGQTRRAGLGRAGFYFIMRQILDAGYDEVIIALMARGNKLQGMVKEMKTSGHREYTLYELTR